MASRMTSGMRLNMPPSYARHRPVVASRICAQTPEHPAVVPQRVVPLRRLDNLNDLGQARVAHDPPERLRPDSAFGDPFVAVYARPRHRAGIVEMQALK